MKIENQVCSVEQSIKLVDLGVIPNSILYHIYPTMSSGWKVMGEGMFNVNDDEIEYHPAFTVAELGAMLGSGTKETELFWNQLNYKINGGNSSSICFRCEFVADFVISLIVDGSLAISIINHRLSNA